MTEKRYTERSYNKKRNILGSKLKLRLDKNFITRIPALIPKPACIS